MPVDHIRAADDLTHQAIVGHAATDLQAVHPGGHQLRRQTLGLGQIPAIETALVTGDAQGHGKVPARGLLDPRDGLQQQAAAAFQGVPTVLVLALVALGREKGAQQHVGVGGVQLDAVVTRLPCPHRRRGVLIHDRVQLLQL